MTKRVYRVDGMSCEHCQAAVEQALLGVPGVDKAEVDLQASSASLELSSDVPEQSLATAVAEAGYRLVVP